MILKRFANSKKQEIQACSKQKFSATVNTAYIKYNKAYPRRDVPIYNKAFADRKQYIIEKKYLNQLAPIVDNIAASISRLDAELQYTNAEINIMYAPYTILKVTGKI